MATMTRKETDKFITRVAQFWGGTEKRMYMNGMEL